MQLHFLIQINIKVWLKFKIQDILLMSLWESTLFLNLSLIIGEVITAMEVFGWIKKNLIIILILISKMLEYLSNGDMPLLILQLPGVLFVEKKFLLALLDTVFLIF